MHPSPRVVVERAISLSLLEYRRACEVALQDPYSGASQEDVEESWAGLKELIDDEELDGTFSTCETRELARPLGDWSPQECIDKSWDLESLAALGWALSLVPHLEPYDSMHLRLQAQMDLEALLDMRDDAELRPPEWIERQRDIAELWCWRARTFHFGTHSGGPAPVAELGRLAVNAGYLDSMQHWDTADDEISEALSIAQPRLKSFNWLCGECEDWDSVSVATTIGFMDVHRTAF